jgi:hypothetical protein
MDRLNSKTNKFMHYSEINFCLTASRYYRGRYILLSDRVHWQLKSAGVWKWTEFIPAGTAEFSFLKPSQINIAAPFRVRFHLYRHNAGPGE